MKDMINKTISILLAVLLFMLVFVGCSEKETGPLRICVDLGSFLEVYDPGIGNGTGDGDQQHAMRKFEADFKAHLQMNSLEPIELEIEYIPQHIDGGNSERDTTIARLRTEIMSGKGPDIFLLGSNRRDIEPLFKVPEKNIANGVFLPLNSYIENAEFMEFDKLVPGVMSAGKSNGEQYILPLTYTMPLTIYNGNEVQDTASNTITWKQMLEGEEYLRNAAYFFPEIEYGDLFLQNSLGQIVDYENDKLLLTEEELLERTEKMIALEHNRSYSDDVNPELPTNWQVNLCYGFDQLARWRGYRPDLRPFEEEIGTSLLPLEDPFTIVPMYSDDGGVIATVLTYAAINANTKQPEKAFYVLDYLFGLKRQQSSDVFHLTCTDAIPVHMDLMQEEYPLLYLGTYCLEEGTYNEWREILKVITGANFTSEIYYELESMYRKCAYTAGKGGSYDGIVAETYDILKQIIAE